MEFHADKDDIDGLMEEMELAMELRPSCTNQSICRY